MVKTDPILAGILTGLAITGSLLFLKPTEEERRCNWVANGEIEVCTYTLEEYPEQPIRAFDATSSGHIGVEHSVCP